MEQLYIADVADVTFEDKKTGEVVFTGEAQVSSVSGEEESEKIFGGIGNRHIYTIRHSKELTLGITNATFNLNYMAMTQGASIENETTTIIEYERSLVVEGGNVTLKDNKLNDKVRLKNKLGVQEEFDAVDGVVEVDSDFAEDGERVDAVYNKDVHGQTVIWDATKFSHSYKVTYRTIVYSVESSEVVADLYFVFPNASPAGSFEISLENGEAYTPELEFDAMAEVNSTELGRIIQVPREENDTP